MSGDPMKHHVDCDYRNSMLAVQADELFGVPEGEQASYVFDCNLGCGDDPQCARCGNGTFGASVCGVCRREQKAVES